MSAVSGVEKMSAPDTFLKLANIPLETLNLRAEFELLGTDFTDLSAVFAVSLNRLVFGSFFFF